MATAVLPQPAEARPPSPPAGRWAVDPGRARVAFSGRASFLGPTVSARFAGVSGQVAVARSRSRDEQGVRVEVDLTSLTTGNGAWDELVAAVDPFDGTLSLRGVTRTVALRASYDVGRAADRMVVRAAGAVDRQAFGLRFEVPGVGRLVPRRLRLDIDVDVVRLPQRTAGGRVIHGPAAVKPGGRAAVSPACGPWRG